MSSLNLKICFEFNFPFDLIEPVNPGIKGADVLQKVHSPTGQECGTLVWESKNTKNWNDKWISKLKDDQRQIKAAAAILVSVVLPDVISHFGSVEGVWVTDFHSAVGVATILRESLIQVSVARHAAEGKNEKMEMLYSYLSGTDFKQRVEPIVSVQKCDGHCCLISSYVVFFAPVAASRSAIQTLMTDCRVTPNRSASRSISQ